MENNKELISEIDNRVQLVIALAMFFPSLVYFLMVSSGQADKESSNISLLYAAPFVYYLVDYVLYQFFKKRLLAKHLQYINRLILFGIIVYILPVIYMVARKFSAFPKVDQILYKLGLLGIQVAPVMILFSFVYFAFYYAFRLPRK